jgi:hypothetical protein
MQEVSTRKTKPIASEVFHGWKKSGAACGDQGGKAPPLPQPPPLLAVSHDPQCGALDRALQCSNKREDGKERAEE